jgi:hypothetical protein
VVHGIFTVSNEYHQMLQWNESGKRRMLVRKESVAVDHAHIVLEINQPVHTPSNVEVLLVVLVR